MAPKLTPELKKLKDEFDFLHKKIGELYWERETIFYGRRAIMQEETDRIDDQIQNYADNIDILLQRVREEVRRANNASKKPQPK